MKLRHFPGASRLQKALASVLGVVALAAAAEQDHSPAAVAGRAEPLHYRTVAARHLYDVYRPRIFSGKLPPLLYAIAVVETEIDANGTVVSAVVTREPAAATEVGPRIVSMIHAAGPFPRPPGGHARFHETWLVDHSGTFQLHTLTEGQH